MHFFYPTTETGLSYLSIHSITLTFACKDFFNFKHAPIKQIRVYVCIVMNRHYAFAVAGVVLRRRWCWSIEIKILWNCEVILCSRLVLLHSSSSGCYVFKIANYPGGRCWVLLTNNRSIHHKDCHWKNIIFHQRKNTQYTGLNFRLLPSWNGGHC